MNIEDKEAFTKPSPEKGKAWMKRHPVLTVLGVIIFISFIGSAFGDHTQPPEAAVPAQPIVADTSSSVSQQPTEVKESPKLQPQKTSPVVAPTAKSYQQVFAFSGSGTKKSEPFTITGSRFKIKYDCQGDLCQAFLYHTDGNLESLIMNSSGSVKDETIIYSSGEFYIDANTMGNYTFIVEDYK